MTTELDRTALVVVDVQVGFDDEGFWGPRDNPDCDANVERLVRAWTDAGRPLVLVRHASLNPASPLHPESEGFAFKPYLREVSPDLLVTKSVNSAFLGEPDLDSWLRGQELAAIAVCGITTNHCCETTARMGGNLGYDVRFVSDATHTFDRSHPDGSLVPAAELHRVTEANLHEEFATVVRTVDLVGG